MSKTFFTASSLWKGPDDKEKVVYFSGITQKRYSNLILEDSLDPDYPSGTAFKLIGNSENDLGRVYQPFSTDNLIISNIPNTVSYGIDDDKNLVIFPENFVLSSSEVSVIKCKLIKNYASIFKSNLVSFDSVVDFSILREKSITSMLSTDDGIFLAGVSGKVWFYDGYVIKGPVFITSDQENLPATCLLQHKFYHEDESYIYVASDVKPRLYRSKVSNARFGTDWEQVYAEGELASSSGGILSMTSGMNKIFLGCRDNKVLKYTRTNGIVLVEPDDFVSTELIETDNPIESLETIYLNSNNLNDFEPKYSDIRCLENARNQIFAGLSNKSEIWSYTEIPQENPANSENWANYYFDEVFRNDPAPAQYYSYNSSTFSRNDTNLATSKFIDNSSKNYVKESIVIKGNTLSSTGNTVLGQRFFEFSDGSDWEQALRLNLPSQEFIELHCATTSELSSLTDNTIIDGYELQKFDFVLVKDQTSESTITNGIYRYVDGSLQIYNNFIVNTNSTILGFYIKNGNINGKSRYFITVDNFQNNNFEFYKSKYSFEIEAKNLGNTKAIDCTTLDECVYLNTLVDNDERYLSATGYTGYQGVEIADLYGIYNFQFNNNNFKLSSGNKTIEKTLPSFGLDKSWIFSSSGLAATTEGWTSLNYVTSMIGTTESVSDFYSNNYLRYMLRITPSLFGDPSIEYKNLNLEVDPESEVKIRARLTPVSSFGFENSKIKLSWSTNNSSYVNSISTQIETNDDFVEYTLAPIWKDTVENLKLEFTSLPENSDRPTNIDIDYIKIENSFKAFDLNKMFSKIRVNVEDRDIKVWLGNQEYPFIYAKNFISLDNYNQKYLDRDLVVNNYTKPYIKFGKIDNKGGNSLFAFSRMSFIVGENYEPVAKKILNFQNSQKLTSTGGVRLFTYHDGTLYCATDGFDSNNVNINPDDRQSKLFSFDKDSFSWKWDQLSFDRLKIDNNDGTYSLLGIVRPVNGISYKGNLYLSGQYANIKVN